MLKQDYTNTLSNLPLLLRLGANSHDRTHRLVRRHDGTWRFIHTLPDLIIGVAEACGANLDEDIVFANLRHRNFTNFIFRFILEMCCEPPAEVIIVRAKGNGQIVP